MQTHIRLLKQPFEVVAERASSSSIGIVFVFHVSSFANDALEVLLSLMAFVSTFADTLFRLLDKPLGSCALAPPVLTLCSGTHLCFSLIAHSGYELQHGRFHASRRAWLILMVAHNLFS